MTAPRPFDWADAERRLGPDAMAAMDRAVEAAPPLSPEIRAKLRALFAPAVARAAAVEQRRDAA